MSCGVKHVMFVIKCNGYKELYVSQTGDKRRTRKSIHEQKLIVKFMPDKSGLKTRSHGLNTLDTA